MSVHYKFKSALEYDTVTFDGLHISVKDLKNSIVQQKRIGKNTDFDLQVTNAQTKEVYEDDNALIPKNTSLLIARIPTSVQTKNKQWEGYGGDSTPPTKLDEGGPIAKAVDLSSLDAPEDDKIKAMMSQSTQDYDPSNYMKIRGANQMGAVPPNYRCYKCHQMGHWIKDCPLSKGPEPIEIKKSTGIPLSFMVPVEGPQVQGAMMTPNGSYAVPVLDHQTYTQKPSAPAPLQEPKPEIPEDLLCSICSDLLSDAVMIPCCGNSFCDECIRSFLLESEDRECPDCHEKDISPGTLIPNRFLRNSVANFKNSTGYVKKPVYKQVASRQMDEVKEVKIVKEVVPPALPAESKTEIEEKTVISEADSTEHSKNEEKVKGAVKGEPEAIPEGPPGVSPVESPKGQSIKSVSASRERTTNSRPHKHRSRDESPRRHHRNHRSPPFTDTGRGEERAGTPTVDEPGMASNPYPPPDHHRSYPSAPSGPMPPMMGVGPPMQPPPPAMNPGYPAGQPMGNFGPTNGPPPNFRLPPPGPAPPPYMPPGPYQVPSRPMFDQSRAPIAGPPPMYNPSYAPSSRTQHHRDFGIAERRIRGRTPSGVIDDPLAAFNRMLREKDERERRAKRKQRRSYSRSRSRSRSYSRSPRRLRSRSPRRRQSRSRSRSFSISRSRSRSFSGSMRGSPFRDFSPRHSPRRRGPSRYRSPPVRSPPRHRFKESHPPDRFRDRDYDRDYGREDVRPFSRDREHRREERERDRNFDYYDNFDDRSRSKQQQQPPPQQQQQQQWGQQAMTSRGPEGYYPPEMQPHPYPPNRYPPRDFPPYLNKNEVPPHVMPPNQSMHMMSSRRYEDVAPPGVEEPPVPGLDPAPKYEFDRFDRAAHPNARFSPDRETKPAEEKKVGTEKKRKHEKRSRSPEKTNHSPSVKRKSKSRDEESPEKHKRRKRESSQEKKAPAISEDDKAKKNKEKKKKREKKDSEKKKRKEKKDKHKKDDKKHKEEVSKEVEEKKEELVKEETKIATPEPRVEAEEPEPKTDLYDEGLLEGVDANVVETYGKIKETSVEKDDFPIEDSKDYEDSEKDILEIHTTDIDLKAELEGKNEMLAQLPEKSKWEVEEDASSQTSPKDSVKSDTKTDKSGKVTNEVLKRAENAIFAKAINAIRPIEIKKISTDRAKLYSGENDDEKGDEIEVKHVAIEEKIGEESSRKKSETAQAPRLSVKDRLGVKVDDDDRVVKVDRKSRSVSPFSRRGNEIARNYGLGERRVEVVERRRYEDRNRHRDGRNPRRDFHRDDHSRRGDNRRRDTSRRRDEKRSETKKERPKSEAKTKQEDDKKEKRKRSRSRSESDERKRKRKEKKPKKDKVKKHQKDDEEKQQKEEKSDETQKPKAIVDKRKPTIDEANFVPDYDLESESEKEDAAKKEKVKVEEKKSSSSSESSESSSGDERRKKRHRKHKKKKTRKESSSSSSESESESSDDDRDKKKKKHKRKQKKKKRSKHK